MEAVSSYLQSHSDCSKNSEILLISPLPHCSKDFPLPSSRSKDSSALPLLCSNFGVGFRDGLSSVLPCVDRLVQALLLLVSVLLDLPLLLGRLLLVSLLLWENCWVRGEVEIAL